MILDLLARLDHDGDPADTLVVGLPRRLDGSPNGQTPLVERFVARLRAATPLTVVMQDERLSSHEAESRLVGARARLAQAQGAPRRRRGGRHPSGLPRRGASRGSIRFRRALLPMRRLIIVLVLAAGIVAAVAGGVLRPCGREIPGLSGGRSVRRDRARHRLSRDRPRPGRIRRRPRRADVPDGDVSHRHRARAEGRRISVRRARCRRRKSRGSSREGTSSSGRSPFPKA